MALVAPADGIILESDFSALPIVNPEYNGPIELRLMEEGNTGMRVKAYPCEYIWEVLQNARPGFESLQALSNEQLIEGKVVVDVLKSSCDSPALLNIHKGHSLHDILKRDVGLTTFVLRFPDKDDLNAAELKSTHLSEELPVKNKRGRPREPSNHLSLYYPLLDHIAMACETLSQTEQAKKRGYLTLDDYKWRYGNTVYH